MLTALSPAAPINPFTLLDDPREWPNFGKPAHHRDGCWESSLLIEGMFCAACAVTVEDALRALPGVVGAEVSAGSHRARVIWSPDVVMPSDLLKAVQQAGYRAVPGNDVSARERRQAQTRKELWRWLVAGFCMMQVMMYAYPAYVAGPGDLSAEMEQLLRWASWVLTLPVIVFSCGPFFASALKDIVRRRISMDLPVALGMLITFVVSTAGTFDSGGPFGREVYFDSLTMFVFFLLTGRWLELRLRDQTAGALEALMNRLPDTVERQTRPPGVGSGDIEVQDGVFERVAVRCLAPGDVIRVLPGESFPADGLVLQGSTLADEALLTGESRPVPRDLGDEVVAGSHNLSGVVFVRVERVGENTRYGEIVALMEEASTSKPQLARLADRVARPFLIAVLLCAAVAGAFWWSRDPGQALMVAVAVLIVTCPCALSLATPAAMLASAGALAKGGVLVRRLQALEVLSSVDTVIFDKTGTLTGESLVLGEVHTRPGMAQAQVLALAAALAGNSRHPLSRALATAAAFSGEGMSNQWKASSVQEVVGQGMTGVVGSAGQVRLGSAIFCGLQETGVTAAGESPRVFLSDVSGWLATFELREGVRPDAAATVSALQASGIEVHLLSGDRSQAVAQVAMQLGIHHVTANCTPQEKLKLLRDLQRQGHQVAMVGDGLNDAPVLAGAQVSFAFGQAVPVAQARADFVILGDSLLAIAQTVALARRTLSIVRQNLWWAAIYNATCIPLAVLGYLPAWLAGAGMATSSLAVVLNALRLSRGLPKPVSP
jgi:P-type Cu2+ transporter